MSRIRKALAAAGGAFITGMATALINGDQPVSQEGWLALIAGCLGAALTVGFATYQLRNEGTVIGSDPVPPGSRIV
jgi:hypothetical protein